MARVRLRFYEELNDLLAPKLRKVDFTHEDASRFTGMAVTMNGPCDWLRC